MYIKSVYISSFTYLLILFATHLTVQATLGGLHQYSKNWDNDKPLSYYRKLHLQSDFGGGFLVVLGHFAFNSPGDYFYCFLVGVSLNSLFKFEI